MPNSSDWDNFVTLNHIGTGFANELNGVLIDDGYKNVIGDATETVNNGNVISGNKGYGVQIVNGSESNQLRANRIGLSAFGDAMPNRLGGVHIHESSFNGIGLNPTLRNIISGNGVEGGPDAHDVLIQGSRLNRVAYNYVGFGPNLENRGNTGSGVFIESTDEIAQRNYGTGNKINFNAGAQIRDRADPDPDLGEFGNSIEGGQFGTIGANGGLGIDRGFAGVTPNDDPDDDDILNYPVIDTATMAGGVISVSGTLLARPDATYTLDFYGNTVAHPSNHGPGEKYLDSLQVTTNMNGDASSTSSLRRLSARSSPQLQRIGKPSTCRSFRLPSPSPCRAAGISLL